MLGGALLTRTGTTPRASRLPEHSAFVESLRSQITAGAFVQVPKRIASAAATNVAPQPRWISLDSAALIPPSGAREARQAALPGPPTSGVVVRSASVLSKASSRPTAASRDCTFSGVTPM